MRLLGAFLKLIRLPNLFFIVLTQFLFYYCILVPVLRSVDAVAKIDQLQFILLSLASVLIAAAGYIINDYFDVNIDQVNKPKKNVVDIIVTEMAVFRVTEAGLVLDELQEGVDLETVEKNTEASFIVNPTILSQ